MGQNVGKNHIVVCIFDDERNARLCCSIKSTVSFATTISKFNNPIFWPDAPLLALKRCCCFSQINMFELKSARRGSSELTLTLCRWLSIILLIGSSCNQTLAITGVYQDALDNSDMMEGSPLPPCHLDTNFRSVFGVLCYPQLADQTAFFNCNSTETKCSDNQCEQYDECSEALKEHKICEVQIKFTKLVEEDDDGSINSYNLSQFKNCSTVEEIFLTIEFVGRDLNLTNNSIITGIADRSMSSLVFDDTNFTSTQLEMYVQNNFRLAERIFLNNNANLKELNNKVFEKLILLNSVVVQGGAISKIGSNTFNITNNWQELKLLNLPLGTGGMSAKSIIISDLGCKNLLINITNCGLSEASFAPEAIKMTENKKCPNKQFNITIDMRSNEFNGQISGATFEPLIKHSVAHNRSLFILYDKLDCCADGNRWIFNLNKRERESLHTSCSKLNVPGGLGALEEFELMCKSSDAKLIVLIVLGCVATLILFVAACICCGPPRRDIIMLASKEKTYTGSQNSNSHMANQKSTYSNKTDVKRKGIPLVSDATTNYVIMPIADDSNKSRRSHKSNEHKTTRTSEGAFLAAKSIPTISKSSSSGAKKHADRKLAVSPRSPLLETEDLSKSRPVRTSPKAKPPKVVVPKVKLTKKKK